jgi:glutamate-1-semialdehyde 2,1-aminomutase
MASKALAAEGVPHVAQWAGNLFSVFFVDDRDTVSDFAQAQDQALYRFRAFFHAMLARGVSLPPSAFEAWFVNSALDDGALDRVAAALPAAARAAAAARPDFPDEAA